jgi:hypothetical protein
LRCGNDLFYVCVDSRLELSSFQELDEQHVAWLAAARLRLEPLRRRVLSAERLSALREPRRRPSPLAERRAPAGMDLDF